MNDLQKAAKALRPLLEQYDADPMRGTDPPEIAEARELIAAADMAAALGDEKRKLREQAGDTHMAGMHGGDIVDSIIDGPDSILISDLTGDDYYKE